MPPVGFNSESNSPATWGCHLWHGPIEWVFIGRKLVLRFLAWNDWQPVFFRLAAALSRPLLR